MDVVVVAKCAQYAVGFSLKKRYARQWAHIHRKCSHY